MKVCHLLVSVYYLQLFIRICLCIDKFYQEQAKKKIILILFYLILLYLIFKNCLTFQTIFLNLYFNSYFTLTLHYYYTLGQKFRIMLKNVTRLCNYLKNNAISEGNYLMQYSFKFKFSHVFPTLKPVCIQTSAKLDKTFPNFKTIHL